MLVANKINYSLHRENSRRLGDGPPTGRFVPVLGDTAARLHASREGKEQRGR